MRTSRSCARRSTLQVKQAVRRPDPYAVAEMRLVDAKGTYTDACIAALGGGVFEREPMKAALLDHWGPDRLTGVELAYPSALEGEGRQWRKRISLKSLRRLGSGMKGHKAAGRLSSMPRDPRDKRPWMLLRAFLSHRIQQRRSERI